MKVYLDDERKTPEGWHRTYTAAETIALLETGRVDELSLDHDLAEEHYAGELDSRTGYAVVVWLESRVNEDPAFRMPIVRLHTQNPVGRASMAAGLERIRRTLLEREAAR